MAALPLSLQDTLYLINMARLRSNSSNIHPLTNKCLWVLWVAKRFSETGQFPENTDPEIYRKKIIELKKFAGL